MERDAQGGIRPLYWEAIQAFSLMDDVFMTAVFQDSLPCVDLVIQIILNRPDIHATRVVTQDTIKNLQGHDVRLDIHAVADGQEFNIEIQRDKKGASERRARYHSSIMDANALRAGADYARLPESYVIFITETDVLGDGQPLYAIRRMIEDSHKYFDDGSHIIYVNNTCADAHTPLGRLMHDFRCTRPEDMYYDLLAKRAGYFKHQPEGAEKMSAVMEELIRDIKQQEREEGRAEGRAEGQVSERIFSIRTLMANLELTAEKAMDALSIPQTERGRYRALL